ncbi:MAG TPA: glycosyltransferase family protein [Bacteroidia bacterium]|nr:glycosyltransferase family protein [Bacteroidia bacterium]
MSTKVLFVVQGEGRGHMTQAISMKQILDRNGFTVCGVLVGSSNRREIPQFFLDHFKDVTVQKIQSPNFVTSKNRKIKIWPTITHNFSNARKYMRSAKLLRLTIEETEADVVLNFYEPTCGLYHLMLKKSRKIPMISIAHQYLTGHSKFKFPNGHLLDKIMLKLYTDFTSAGSEHHFGLSFYPLANEKKSRIRVVPPLLRREVMQKEVRQENYFLCYLVNSGYVDDLIQWADDNPGTTLHIFSDIKSDEEMRQLKPNLFLHRLNDKKFLEYMAACQGVISSAGFESVCEAMWLGKPVFMVPVEGHFEQLCNAVDALRAGAGIYDRSFKISRFLEWLPTWSSKSLDFRQWEQQAETLFVRELKAAINTTGNVTGGEKEILPA